MKPQEVKELPPTPDLLVVKINENSYLMWDIGKDGYYFGVPIVSEVGEIAVRSFITAFQMDRFVKIKTSNIPIIERKLTINETLLVERLFALFRRATGLALLGGTLTIFNSLLKGDSEKF